MNTRCQRFRSAFKKLSLAKRIIASNVFILSMPLHVNFHYPLPYKSSARSSADAMISAMARRCVVHYQTGYEVASLYAPLDRLGPSPALIDPMCKSIAISASQADLAQFEWCTHEEEPRAATRHLEGSMVIADLHLCQAADFVHAHLWGVYEERGESRTFRVEDFYARSPRTFRSNLYRRLVYCHHHY